MLVLYVLSIMNTILKDFDRFTELGCVQNMSPISYPR